MPAGHTDRDTVNARVPMSEGMAELLRHLVKVERCTHRGLSNAGKNRMRGLMDRGYAVPTESGDHWIATDAGREAAAT